MDLGAEESAWGGLGLIPPGWLQTWSGEKAWSEVGRWGDGRGLSRGQLFSL